MLAYIFLKISENRNRQWGIKMGVIKELSYFKLHRERAKMLEQLRESNILDTANNIEYTEVTTRYGGNVISGEPSLELSVKFTVFEEVTLSEKQVKELESDEGQYKLIGGEYVRPIDIEIVFKTVGEDGSITSFYCDDKCEGNSNLSRQMNYYFSKTQNGTSHVNSAFEVHELIVKGAYKELIDCVVKHNDTSLYSRILDEILLPSDSALIKLNIKQSDLYYKVVYEKQGNIVELDIASDRGIANQLAVLFK